MSVAKNVLLNWYSSMKKKLRTVPMIFDIENWLWKSNFGTFWQLANNFLWVCWFLGKNLSNFVSPVWKLHNPYCHRSGDAIDAIRFQYGPTWGPWHGSNQGVNSDPIELQHGERIIKIQGTTNPHFYNMVNVISSLEFHTNQGRKIGPYGQPSSNDVPWAIEREQCALAWIAGDSSNPNLMNQSGYIRSLSFKFQC